MVYSDQSASPPAPAPAEGTRERVLQLVLTRGPVSAAEIGRELELTAAAVRRHLDALEEDSLVEVKRVTAARGAGRPSRRYVVTSHAQEHLPKDHLAVALDTLARLEEHRAAGHRTVLVTGSPELLVSPVADLFDEVVASL